MKWLGIALAIGTLVLTLILCGGNQRLITPEAPRGGLSLQFPESPGEARRIITSWQALDELGHAKAHIHLDFLFIPFYSGLMIFACLALRSPTCRRFAVPGAIIAAAAGAFDVLEDLGMLSLIDCVENGVTVTPWLTTVVYASAFSKFALLLLTVIAVVALALCRAINRPRSSSR